MDAMTSGTQVLETFQLPEFKSYLDGGKICVPTTYYGGKANHLLFILAFLKTKEKMMEAFCGSTATTINFHRSPIEIINDIDSRVSNYFTVLQDNILSDKLLDKLSITIVSEEDFYKAKIVSPDPIEDARRFQILANQSYMSGQEAFQFTPNVVRQSMSQNVSRWLGRFPHVERAVLRVKMFQVRNTDGVELIKRNADRNTMVFCDPPYPKEVRVATDVYQHEMPDERHDAFLDVCDDSDADIAISSYESAKYDRRLLEESDKWIKVLANPKRLSGHGSVRTECLYLNYPLESIEHRIHESILKKMRKEGYVT